MQVISRFFYFGLIISILASCNSETRGSKSSFPESYEKDPSEQDDEIDNDYGIGDCGLSDDTYTATVDYYNPQTDYSQTYTLDVEVEDCQVIQIDFPKGGWLDEDHIDAADIDEDGNATVDGEDGKTYEIHIDY